MKKPYIRDLGEGCTGIDKPTLARAFEENFVYDKEARELSVPSLLSVPSDSIVFDVDPNLKKLCVGDMKVLQYNPSITGCWETEDTIRNLPLGEYELHFSFEDTMIFTRLEIV